MPTVKKVTTKKSVKRPPSAQAAAATMSSSNGTIKEKTLALECALGAINKKATDSIVLDVTDQGSFTDYFFIASGSSEKQVQAMADEILGITKNLTKDLRLGKPTVEGYEQGRWILIDFGPVVVHLFHADLREYYRLESIWPNAARVEIPSDFYTSSNTRQLQ